MNEINFQNSSGSRLIDLKSSMRSYEAGAKYVSSVVFLLIKYVLAQKKNRNVFNLVNAILWDLKTG